MHKYRVACTRSTRQDGHSPRESGTSSAHPPSQAHGLQQRSLCRIGSGAVKAGQVSCLDLERVRSLTSTRADRSSRAPPTVPNMPATVSDLSLSTEHVCQGEHYLDRSIFFPVPASPLSIPRSRPPCSHQNHLDTNATSSLLQDRRPLARFYLAVYPRPHRTKADCTSNDTASTGSKRPPSTHACDSALALSLPSRATT